MRKTVIPLLVVMLLSSILVIPIDIVVGDSSVHVAPVYVDVEVEQTPYTVVVVIVANFNETEVEMNITRVTIDALGDYSVEVDIFRAGGFTAGNLNLSAWTTLGIPEEGNHMLYVEEPTLGYTLATKEFTMLPVDTLFSQNGIIGSLRTYLNYNEDVEMVPPTMYNYTRFWINSTSMSPLTLGIRLNNTLSEAINNGVLILDPPYGVNLSIDPSIIIYGTLSSDSSKVGFFNMTTEDVQPGIYNVTYRFVYNQTDGTHIIKSIIPAGVFSTTFAWFSSNTTAIVSVTTPFMDNGTNTFYNYTTGITRDGYNWTSWQDFNSTYTLGNISGSLNSPFWGQLGGALIGGGLELFQQKVIEGRSWKDIQWGKVILEVAQGAAFAAIGKKIAEIAAYRASKYMLNFELIDKIEKATYRDFKKITDGIDLSTRVGLAARTIQTNKLTAKDKEGNKALLSPVTTKGKGDYKPTTLAGTTVQFTLAISKGAGGTTNPSPGTYTYQAGTIAYVTAVPYTDYRFDHWELDGANVGATNPISVTMNTNHALRAVFVYSPPPPPPPPQGVGGVLIPIDKVGLLAPYIGSTSAILVGAVAAAIHVKRVKRRKEKQ